MRLGDTLGMHVGEEVGSGVGLPFLYVGSSVGDSVGAMVGKPEGCGVGLPNT